MEAPINSNLPTQTNDYSYQNTIWNCRINNNWKHSFKKKWGYKQIKSDVGMSNNKLNFGSLVSVIEQTHQHFQQQAVKAVNVSLTVRNWLVGYYIVTFKQKGEDRAAYGSKLLSNLAESSKNIKGFDERSFRNFRMFYKLYPYLQTYIAKNLSAMPIGGSLTTELSLSSENEEFAIMRSLTTESKSLDFLVLAEKIISQLSYTHIEQLLPIQDPLKRAFYEVECIKGICSVRELKRQINSLYFERCGMNIVKDMQLDDFSEIEIICPPIKLQKQFSEMSMQSKNDF